MVLSHKTQVPRSDWKTDQRPRASHAAIGGLASNAAKLVVVNNENEPLLDYTIQFYSDEQADAASGSTLTRVGARLRLYWVTRRDEAWDLQFENNSFELTLRYSAD